MNSLNYHVQDAYKVTFQYMIVETEYRNMNTNSLISCIKKAGPILDFMMITRDLRNVRVMVEGIVH